ncbi:ParE family toxin-like protein [Vibrio vulnificus]|uniref:ParE family toxin-like protein n=1 Tax=Vibrio vulnificus TaxID=672 RepID=UPI0005C58ECB
MYIKQKGIKDEGVLKKAYEALINSKPRKLKESGYLSIKVGRNYRLLKRGQVWELMTHERYNRYV